MRKTCPECKKTFELDEGFYIPIPSTKGFLDESEKKNYRLVWFCDKCGFQRLESFNLPKQPGKKS